MHQDMDNPILVVNRMVERAEEYLDEQSKEREKALKYYDGDPKAIPHDEGWSFSVSKDLRASVKKLLPSIMRTIFGSNKAVEYQPVGPGEEEAAKQASDYVNSVVMRDTRSKKAIESAIWDALVLKTGILEWVATEREKVGYTEHTDQPDTAVDGVIGNPEFEISDHVKERETDPELLAMDKNAMRHSYKVKHREKEVICELKAVPRGSFLISPMATIENAPLVGKKEVCSRSELVSEGYDKDLVDSLRCQGAKEDDDKFERFGEDWTDLDKGAAKASEDVEYYDVYARLDVDGDGISELYHVVYGEGRHDGKGAEKFVVLRSEPCDEVPFTEVVAENDAHQFEGHSVFEDMEDIQRIKTVLLRRTLDNLNLQNNHQRAIKHEAVANKEAITNPQIGQDILIKKEYDVRDAVMDINVPFFAAQSFDMMRYMDEVAKDRTGITDASGGINPEGFQNISATAAHIASEAGVAQADMIVRNLAEGIGRGFKGLLGLIVAHQEETQTVWLRGDWVNFDPQSWNSEMDCVVNVGLGGGTRERDMAMLQIVQGLQEKLLASIGPNNPYVKPDQLYNTLEKITEAAGFPDATPFFTKPDEKEVAALMAQPGDTTEQDKLALEKAKAQADIELQREKQAGEMQLAREKMQAETQLARERMHAEMAMGSAANLTSPIRMGGQIG